MARNMARNMARTIAMFSLVLALVAPATALAWGAEGHRLVADIALHFLTPAARKAVDALLAADAELDPDSRIRSLADASVWADEVRSLRPETRGWHFDNIPLCGTADPARYCVNGNCASAQIERLRGVLADPNAGRRDRLEALKYLVHFIGDIHQPLHSADNDDRGGNAVPVAVAGAIDLTNLHAHWDFDLVRRFTAERHNSASALAKRIRPEEQVQWSRGRASDWVAQIHRVAADIAYGKLPSPPVCGAPSSEPATIDSNYYRSVRPVLTILFKQAGIRLAAVLNEALP